MDNKTDTVSTKLEYENSILTQKEYIRRGDTLLYTYKNDSVFSYNLEGFPALISFCIMFFFQLAALDIYSLIRLHVRP